MIKTGILFNTKNIAYQRDNFTTWDVHVSNELEYNATVI